MKKISFIFFFIIFGCTKSEVDLRIVDAADIFDQVAAHAGQDVVLVNFWATHCSPCIEEMPYILELEQEYKNQGFKVYFVSNDWLDRKNAVFKFLINIGVRGISFLTDELDDNEFINNVHEDWSGALPFTLVFDRKGKLVDYWQNKKTKEFFESAINKALVS
jgi:thiol-disulfide isomerase/thioredoxin